MGVPNPQRSVHGLIGLCNISIAVGESGLERRRCNEGQEVVWERSV